MIERQIQDITFAIAEAKAEDDGKSFTVKQMEKTKKTLQAKLQKLNDQSRKDDVVTFEQLGVDRLFVDESHFYKNMFLYTKIKISNFFVTKFRFLRLTYEAEGGDDKYGL